LQLLSSGLFSNFLRALLPHSLDFGANLAGALSLYACECPPDGPFPLAARFLRHLTAIPLMPSVHVFFFYADIGLSYGHDVTF